MKIIVHLFASDDDNGTSASAFATEVEAEDELLGAIGHDREAFEAWLEEHPGGDIWEFKDDEGEHDHSLDTYNLDEERIDFDLCAQPLPATGVGQVQEAIECLQRARDLLKASDNKQTLKRVRLALSSAKGAARIQNSRRTRLIMEAETLHNSADLDDGGFTDEEKADQKHNAQMLDGCETEDEFNAELRAQTQGDA